MKEKFLKAKHWQIFIVTFGLPFLLDLILMPMSIENTTPGDMIKFMPVIMIVFMAGFFGWLWSIAIGLQEKVPSDVKMKVSKFKIFFFIPLVYILLIMGFMGTIFGGVSQEPNVALIGVIMAIIIPIHLLSMFGVFYSLYFVAKTFKTVELQKEVSFSDFGGEFFLIWFFPIGIWIIQPKINKMIS